MQVSSGSKSSLDPETEGNGCTRFVWEEAFAPSLSGKATGCVSYPCIRTTTPPTIAEPGAPPSIIPSHDDHTTAATHRGRREGRHEGRGEGAALHPADAPDGDQERAHPPGERGGRGRLRLAGPQGDQAAGGVDRAVPQGEPRGARRQ